MSAPAKRFLTTFVAPKPNKTLIQAMTWANRWLNLYGTPGLRDVPYLNRLPLVRGLCDIRHLDLPAADDVRLKATLAADGMVFITPNHPEFFTDWMLDKEIAARYAPMMANWATHDIVNGMGRWGQKFWLANNLVAQVPGDTEQALAYSIDTAAAGTPVLLHPEGSVHWQGDHINTLFQGAAKMALQAAAQSSKPVFIQPLIWKLKFIRNEESALHAEMAQVERQLQIEAKPFLNLPLRLARLYRHVLWLRFQNMGFAPPRHLSFFAAQDVLLEKLLLSLNEFGTFSGSLNEQAKQMLGAIRQAEKSGQSIDRMTRRRRSELAFILRNPQEVYPQPRWQQEHIAECLKRLRCDHLAWGGLGNKIHRFVPRPVGGRNAHIRVAEPLNIRALLAEQPDLDAAALTALLQQQMQQTLDQLNVELNTARSPQEYANPFVL